MFMIKTVPLAFLRPAGLELVTFRIHTQVQGSHLTRVKVQGCSEATAHGDITS